MVQPEKPESPEQPKTVTVPNPHYTELQDLHKDVLAVQHTIGKALHTSAQLMHGGSAWTGPTAAKSFAEEVSGRDQRLPGLVNQILSAIEAEMASTPQTMERPMNRGMY